MPSWVFPLLAKASNEPSGGLLPRFAMRQPNSSGNTSIKAERIFLLSPANIGGIRGSGLMSGLMQSLKNQGAPLGEVFSFISGLYFRGKLAYSQKFAKVTDGVRPVYVITASAGLIPYETQVTLERLREVCAGQVDITNEKIPQSS